LPKEDGLGVDGKREPNWNTEMLADDGLFYEAAGH